MGWKGRVFWAGGLAAVLGLASLLGLVTLFLTRPQLFVTPRTVSFLLTRFGAAYGPRWEGLEASAESLGGGRHRYGFGLAGLCLADAAGSVSACFERVDVIVTVAYSRRGVTLEKVDRLVALGRSLRLEPAKRPSGGRGMPGLPAWPSSGFGLVRVELPSVVVADARGRGTGSLNAAYDPAAILPLSLKMAFSVDAPGLQGKLTSAASADSDGAVGWAEFRADRGAFRSAKLSECRWKGGSAAELTCRFAVAPVLGADARLAPFRTLTGGLRLTGGVKGREYAFGLTAVIDPVKDWYAAAGQIAAEAKGTLGEAPAVLDVQGSLDATAPRFEDVVNRLRDSAYAVPAPFHVLKGPLTLKASARGDPRRDEIKADFALTFNLAAGRQKLVGEATADVTLTEPRTPRRSATVDAEVLIKEAAFELPRLEIARVPKAKLDSRIRTGAEPEELRDAAAALPGPGAQGKVRARVALKTAKPIALFSNLVKDPIPLSLDLQGEYPPMSGSGLVSVGGVDVELFRRNAFLHHIDVRLSSGNPHGALEGLILYKTADHVISIHLSGTTDRPLVGFTSVPALNREEILALLIFGKRPGDLDPEALASVGNTQRAIENRSFGLASLYLFGATPIESVAYDGATQNATVKLRLPGGALLQLGSDFERSRGLTLRQPLAPHWAIQSEFSDQGPETRFGTTFLEWFNRY